MHAVLSRDKKRWASENEGVLTSIPFSQRPNIMILSHEKAFSKANTQLEEMVEFAIEAAKSGERIDVVERQLFSRLLGIGHTVLQAFVTGQGDGDAGPGIEQNGVALRRLKGRRQRRYLSIFGEITVKRWVYARRAGQKVEHAPLDARLGLPEGDFSYVLMDWLQQFCVHVSFHEAVAGLRKLLNLAPSERAAEHMNQHLAKEAEGFQLNQPPPEPESEGELLVATADGKGVPMRRPLVEKLPRSSPRRGKGEKANKKQMAYVGAVYSIDRFKRTAADVVDEVCRKASKAKRPRPCHKQMWAEMTRHPEDEATGRERVFVEMAVECQFRDPKHHKKLVCLMDGERALWEMAGTWLDRAVGVLDLFHVLERLWTAAHCFHGEGSTAAKEFVSHRLQMLLEGKVGYVIGGLRRLCNTHRLKGEKQRRVAAAITYYENNREHMRYDEYLQAGYPIGSGVAEGACRHLVKDRMERTGMRWTVAGAQAMLHLRALYLNGRWDEFIDHHIQTEQTRLYGKTAA